MLIPLAIGVCPASVALSNLYAPRVKKTLVYRKGQIKKQCRLC